MEKIKLRSTQSAVNKLINIIEKLRGENGCPWDKKQTPLSMMLYLIEEVYELFDAVESGNPDDVCEELGDVLFQLLFIARLFQEKGHFSIQDVANINSKKMIRRHPHVFSNGYVKNADAVKEQWHRIKIKENNSACKSSSVLDSIPKKSPAMMRAYRISERAARTGFDWDDISGVMQKVEEEWSELKSELTPKNQAKRNQNRVEMEFGDIFFTLVNLARFAHIHPEKALRDSSNKFVKRFKCMEEKVLKNSKNIASLSPGELNQLWEEAKKIVD